MEGWVLLYPCESSFLAHTLPCRGLHTLTTCCTKGRKAASKMKFHLLTTTFGLKWHIVNTCVELATPEQTQFAAYLLLSAAISYCHRHYSLKNTYYNMVPSFRRLEGNIETIALFDILLRLQQIARAKGMTVSLRFVLELYCQQYSAAVPLPHAL